MSEGKATSAWKGNLALALVATALALGLYSTIQTLRNRPVREATMAGIFLQLDSIRWLEDQMDDHEQYPMPAGMTPDLPPHGVFRLSAGVSLRNPTHEPRVFRVSELFLRSSVRGIWPATGADVADSIELGPGRFFNLFAHFDVAENELEGDLQLLWLRDGRTVRMLPVDHPPEHFHDDATEPTVWAAEFGELPAGNIESGAALYAAKHGCLACHGHPDLPDSHTVGPHLAGIGSAAGTRVAGITGEQYIYQAILEPDAFIAEGCKTGPCSTPSAMPPFGELVDQQGMADLIAYLMAQK